MTKEIDLGLTATVKGKKKHVPFITLVLHQDMEEIEAPATYEDCRRQVKEALTSAEVTQVMAYWITGKLVADSCANKQWGDGVVQRLSVDLKKSTSLLYEMKRFYEEYPTLEDRKTMDQIEWSGIRLLNTIPDKDTRAEAAEAVREKEMTVQEIKALVDMYKTPKVEDAETEEEEDDEVEEEEQDTFSTEALRYFSRLEALVEGFRDQLADEVARLPEMKTMASDDEFTTKDDHEAIMEKGQNISVAAKATAEFMALNLYALSRADAFNEVEEE